MIYQKSRETHLYHISAMTPPTLINITERTPKKCSALSLMGIVGSGAIPNTPSRMSHAAVKKIMTYDSNSQCSKFPHHLNLDLDFWA